MLSNAVLVAIVIFLVLAFTLMGQLRFLIPWRALLWHEYWRGISSIAFCCSPTSSAGPFGSSASCRYATPDENSNTSIRRYIVDKTNSQPKSSNASVGSDQPIEGPETNQPSNASEESQNHGEPPSQARPTPAPDRSAPHDDPPRHSRRYYDDSDDVIERVRRAREAFEKKANAFQGPDWPYYDKRIIVGKKKKPTGSDDSAASQTSQSQNSASTLPVEPDKPKE
jgi:hypothetical protein